MNELLKIELNENQEPCISGRLLHQFLEVETPYTQWFERMIDYGFIEKVDFMSFSQKSDKPQGGRPSIDHIIKLDMAKELSMIQRTEKGKQARQYFIEVEKEFNSPDKIMARALQIANNTINNLTLSNTVNKQRIKELEPKATYYDEILNSPSLISITQIAKDYGMSGKALNKKLHELGIQYKQSGTWLLYQKYSGLGYTNSRTVEIERSDGRLDTRLHTYWTQKGRLFLYELLKNNGIYPLIERVA
ncbi:phage antirepressor KilAC domain-containing protein [Anaerosphaera multitolerans]|uniref:Phage antirepressor Ant n=1 Tax=Anaerosphaera multitolerans TaxID=2487351 RepID=A0A437S6L0_9FIRM|nr:phage antirepressor KilAC domain-containing protein [Anaerosphaera multitolerans]RVU54653.1 phage antirepressor Ant [Anaerosphaera multitolerans]